jgi:hypothetical protein
MMSSPESPETILLQVRDVVPMPREAVHLESSTHDGALRGVRDVDAQGSSFSADVPEQGAPSGGLEALGAGAPAGRPTDEDLTHAFTDLAVQYYVAARLAARAFLLPVNGNLFHHAVELCLKAALVGTLTLKQMKKRYGHDIRKL